MTGEPLVHDKRYVVKVRYMRYGSRIYPRSGNVQERIFGSRESHRVQTGVNLMGEPTYRTVHPTITMTAHEVVALVQREIRRAGVDRVTIMVV